MAEPRAARPTVLVGYSHSVLAVLDGGLPPSSVVVLEEPAMIEARGLDDAVRAHPCVAALVPGRVQDEEVEVAELLARLSEHGRPRAVMPSTEYSVVTAARLAERAGLPGAGVAAALALRNKIRLREVCGPAGVPQPRWQPVTGPDDVRAFRAATADRACVLKPANRQGSLGVQRLEAGDDVDEAWRRTTAAEEKALLSGRLRPQFLVEERLRGQEVSVEALVREGRVVFANITDKEVLEGVSPVEVGHVVPSRLNRHTRELLTDLTGRLVEAVGFGSGVLHAEWMVTTAGPRFIECAARLPGDDIDTLIDLSYGGSIALDLAALLADEPVERSVTPTRGAAIRFSVPGPGARVVDGAERRIREMPGVAELELPPDSPDGAAPAASSWDRTGYVICVGPTNTAAAARAVAACAAVHRDPEAMA